MRYQHTFRVIGRLPFPDDMLRYDRCKPASAADAAIIAASHDEEKRALKRRSINPDYVVLLVAENERRYWEPTEGRWRSFSWAVEKDSLVTAKLLPQRNITVRR